MQEHWKRVERWAIANYRYFMELGILALIIVVQGQLNLGNVAIGGTLLAITAAFLARDIAIMEILDKRGSVLTASRFARLAPSLMTAERLALLPFIWWLWAHGFWKSGTAVLAVAVSTDILDGALARALDAVSDLGAFFDGAADKVLIIALLWLEGTIFRPTGFPWQEFTTDFWVIVGLEVALLLVRLPRLWNPALNIHANEWGKAKFWVQIALMLEAAGAFGAPSIYLAPVAILLAAVSFSLHLRDLLWKPNY